MDNKKIPTGVGTVVLAIIAITMGMFVWVYEKGQGWDTDMTTVQLRGVPKEVMKADEQKNQAQKEKISGFPIEVGSKNQTIQIDTWKMYTNNMEGYSIKYPSIWISNFVDGASFYVEELQKTGERYPNFGNVLSDNAENLKNISGDYFINISVYKKIGDHVSLKEWRKYDGTNYQDVLISGHPSLKFEEKPHKSYGESNKDMAGTLRYYFIDNKNDGYEISIWYKDISNGIGDRIISTLSLAN